MKQRGILTKLKELDDEIKKEIVSGVLAFTVLFTAIGYAYIMERGTEEGITEEGYSYEGFDTDYIAYIGGNKKTSSLEDSLKCTGIDGNDPSEAICYFKKGLRVEQVKENVDILSKGYIFDIIANKDVKNLSVLREYEKATEGIITKKDREKYRVYYKEAFTKEQVVYHHQLELELKKVERVNITDIKDIQVLKDKADYLYNYGNLGTKDIKLLSKVDKHILGVKRELKKQGKTDEG